MNFIVFTLNFIAILILPGWFLSVLLLDKISRKDYLSIIPISFVFSISMATPLILLLYVNHLPIDYVVYFTIGMTCILAMMCFSKHKFSSNDFSWSFFSPRYLPQNYPTIIFLIMIITISIYAFVLGGIADGFKTHDSYYFMASIRQMANQGIAVPFDPYYKDIKIINPFYPCNPIFVIFAYLTRISNVETLQLWLWLPTFLLPISVLAIYLLIRTLLVSTRKAVFITIIILLLDLFYSTKLGWYGVDRWQTMAYPNKIGFYILIPTIISLVFTYLRKGKLSYLFSTVLFLFTLVWVYFMGMVILTFTFMLFAIFFLLVRERRRRSRDKIMLRRTISVVSVALLLCLSFVFTMWKTNIYGGLKPIPDITVSSRVDKYKGRLIIFNRYIFMLKPKYFFDDWKRLAAIPIALFLLLRRKKRIGELFFVSSTLGLTFVILCPVSAGLLGNVLPWLALERFKYQIPADIMVGYALFYLVDKLYPKTKKMILSVIVLSFLIVGTWRVYYVKEHQNNGVIFPQDVTSFLRNQIPSKSVILSDEYSGLVIPVMSDLQTITTAKAVTVLIIPEGESRLKEIRTLRNTIVPFETLFNLINKYNTTYILVRKSLWCDEGKRFEEFPELFIKKYNKDDYSIYKVNRNKLEEYFKDNY